jgi:hypothetical protein
MTIDGETDVKLEAVATVLQTEFERVECVFWKFAGGTSSSVAEKERSSDSAVRHRGLV